MKHVTNLRHECESDGCYRAELWDWTPFNDCFGDSGIRISDIDGIVERNGLFLMLDGKRVGRRGERTISNGQRRLYGQFANKGGHVLVFHGQPPSTVQWLRQWLPGGEFIAETACDLDGLRSVVADWYVWANGMRRIGDAGGQHRAPEGGRHRVLEEPVPLLAAPARIAAPTPIADDDWPEVAQPGCGVLPPEYPGAA